MRLLRGYISVVRPHWWGAMMLTAVVAAGIVFTGLQPHVYRAEADAMVSIPGLLVAFPQDVNAELLQARATSYVNLASSAPVAERVARDLRSDAGAASLISRVEVTQRAGTSVLEVRAEDGSPRGAQRLANAWVEALAAEVKKIEGRGDRPRSGVKLTIYAAAQRPTSPASPDLVRNLAAALGLGLLLGFGYAVVRRGRSLRLLAPRA